jgi:hypothetical protein
MCALSSEIVLSLLARYYEHNFESPDRTVHVGSGAQSVI